VEIQKRDLARGFCTRRWFVPGGRELNGPEVNQ
jgi:hypothetical protein